MAARPFHRHRPAKNNIGKLYTLLPRMKVTLSCCMVILFARMALSCGINWSEPRCKIEGCNEQGYVLIAEKLTELNIPDEKESFPIWATFDSSRQTPSPYAGMGWKIPFLESNMVQLSENEFQFFAPSGWKQLFRRSGQDSDVLISGGGWKGQLSPDHATLWADCGWRIDLHKGKIIQMKTPHGQTLTYNYTNGRISSIVCGMKTLVAVDSEEGADNTLGISVDGKHYSLAKTDQPRVQRVAGVNVIGGNSPSFNRLTGPDHQTRSFTYSVDDQTRPVLTITNAAKQDTTVSWDPETRRVTRYGEWKYDIKPGETSVANAAIGRTNSAGKKEFWFLDRTNGKEIVQGLDGIQRTTISYTSGPLVGKIREIKETENGVTRTVLKNSFDEKGRMIRSVNALGVIQTPHFDGAGHFVNSSYDLDNSPDFTARRNAKEAELRRDIDNAPNKYKKNVALRRAAAFYINTLHLPIKAHDLAPQISNETERLSVLLLSIKHNDILKTSEKLQEYQRLLADYPSKTSAITALIADLKKEH